MRKKLNFTTLLQKKLQYHLLFWLAYYAFAACITLTIHHIYDWKFYVQMLSLLPPDAALVYFNLYILIPQFLLRRQFITYFTLVFISITLQSALYIWLHALYARTGTAAYIAAQQFDLRNMSAQFINAIYLLGMTTGLKYVKDWMVREREWQEKERQHTATELDLLKSQIHPHFFFNTLNNLYSLTVQKSDLAPDIVLRLSDLMSYMLYESAAPLLPLDKEIAHLENYIAIEQLRYGNRLDLRFEQTGDTAGIHIPPLLLLTFVENCFKHGTKHTIGPVQITINLQATTASLIFDVQNSLSPERSSPPANPGLGLRNVTRRLDLLYGDRYELGTGEKDNQFAVHLKIPLS